MASKKPASASPLARGAVMLAVIALIPAIAAAQVTVIPVPSAAAPDIQTAINQAAAVVAGPTPTDVVIDVAPGTYTPAAQLDVSAVNSPTFTVTLRATGGPSRTTIDLSNAANFAIFGLGTRNLVIHGFTIRNRIPNENVFAGLGIQLNDAAAVTIVNCHLDTTDQAIRFVVDQPALSAEYHVVNNTIAAGQGTDPISPETTFGTGATIRTLYAPGTVPTGEVRLIAASNVIRTNFGCLRFVNLATDGIGLFGNGSLVATGNDASSLLVSTVNIIGGHGHLVAENRLHDGGNGIAFQSAASGVIENNLIVNNTQHGLVVVNAGLPTQGFSAEPGAFIRHNTIANNAGTGIIYLDATGTGGFVPDVYNNIVAFNNASGLASVVDTSSSFAFIPVSFNLAKDDVFGNTLNNINVAFFTFNYVGISNPQAERPNYSGVINTGLDLAVNPQFSSPTMGNFTLRPTSPLINAGLTTRPTPFQDFALNLRDTPPDIGAYEFVADTPPSTASSANSPASTTKMATKPKVPIQ